MKPETEIRNLKYEVKKLRDSESRWRQGAMFWEGRAKKAEQEVVEWKARFDALLQRTPEVKP